MQDAGRAHETISQLIAQKFHHRKHGRAPQLQEPEQANLPKPYGEARNIRGAEPKEAEQNIPEKTPIS
jgi:hypothetical protein